MSLLVIMLALLCSICISKEQDVNDQPNQLIDYYENSMTRNGRFLSFNYGFIPAASKEAYDFIIVGSGSAGAVIANRLSEIGKWNILLLETGDVPTVLSDIPALASMFQFTNYNWGYLMEKQDNFCLGLEDQRMHWPRGRVLGGTSVIDSMLYVRGNKLDYDRWAALGNPGWSYKDILSYFLKSEDAYLQASDLEYHNTSGHLSVEHVPYRTGSAHAFTKAAQEVGYEYVDYNGESQMGVSYVQSNIRRGERCSAEKAFLRPARHRPNLTIRTGSRVTKVLIDPTTRTAYGVEYSRNKRKYFAKASKEVILSAGAFNSPQLLMLSGIGPKDHLNELGIPVVTNLPVGQKLYDHISFLGLLFQINQPAVWQQNEIDDPTAEIQLLLTGTGPLTSAGVEVLAFLKTKEADYLENYPDMELLFLGGSLHTDGGLLYRRMFRVNNETYDKVWKPLENAYAWSIFPILLHPKSHGYMRLKSRNPYHRPKFYGNFLTDPAGHDLRTLIAGIREVQRIVKAPAFKKLGTQQVTNPIPGCEQHIFDSDPYWECAIRHISSTMHHQIATCKMGPSSDPEAIVDSRLRVYGVKSLRVADTSIIPTTLSAHTNAPAYMIGEKAADIIKEDWSIEHSRIDPKYIKRSVV